MGMYIAIACGGALGAVLRFALSEFILNMSPASSFPYPTVVVNILGSFIIGVCTALLGGTAHVLWLKFLTTGFCGGFTTFSTFSLENANLIANKNYLDAGLNMSMSLIFCFAGVSFGLYVGKFIKQHVA